MYIGLKPLIAELKMQYFKQSPFLENVLMKKTEFLKMAAVAVLSTGLVAGCASDTKEEPAPATDTATTCSDAGSKNAIYSAKVKLARAQKLGYAWRDTAKIIEAAEKASKECDHETAKKLAKQAAEQANDAIAQYYSEKVRYDKNHGKVEAGTGSDSGSDSDSSKSDGYTVVSGDNLWDISGKDSVYGNPYQWPMIYKANSDQIKDADLIYAGQVFSIPTATSADMYAAEEHARTRGAWSIGEVEASDQDYLAK